MAKPESRSDEGGHNIHTLSVGEHTLTLAQHWEAPDVNDANGATGRRPFWFKQLLLPGPQERSEECVGYAVTPVSPNRQNAVRA